MELPGRSAKLQVVLQELLFLVAPTEDSPAGCLWPDVFHLLCHACCDGNRNGVWKLVCEGTEPIVPPRDKLRPEPNSASVSVHAGGPNVAAGGIESSVAFVASVDLSAGCPQSNDQHKAGNELLACH